MDHLPVPKDRCPLETSIPYIATDAPFYDKQGWKTFPSRWGYTSITDIITCQELFSWPQSGHELQALLQSWMFFGLLDEVFGDLEEYRRDDFILTPTEESTATATTSQLLHYIMQKQMSLKLCRGGDFFGRSIEMASIPEVSRIKNLLDYASLQINEWDWFAQGRGELWAMLVLSVRLLVEGLYYAVGESHRHLGVVDLSLTASINYIRQHMLHNHWCTHLFDALCTKVSFTTLVYIANIRRDARDHSKCRTKSRCVAFDTDVSTFTEVQHIHEACRCRHVSAPRQQLIDILSSGGIPVLSCRRNRSGQLIDVRYIRASPGLQYTAVSHLWRDGLGNPFGNSLPDCQLRRLLDDVQSASPIVARYGYFGMATAGTEKAAVTFRAIGYFYHKLSKHWQTTSTVNIWLDVYCIPAAPPLQALGLTIHSSGTDPTTQLSVTSDTTATAAEVKALKETAIKRMDAIYSWASYTLILDREISQITPEIDETELLARLGISAWNTRCWTFQEHSLAQVAAYQCRHGVVFKHVPYGEEPEQMRYWSLTKPTILIPLGLTEDLERLTSPSRLITGGTFWSPPQLEPWRSVDSSVRRFVDAWNSFIGRNTTMQKDLLCIFANLLGLSSSELLKLEKCEDQMKAILAAQKTLPLSLLFVETSRTFESHQKSQMTSATFHSIWIPLPPFRSPLHDRFSGFDMTILPMGLLLEPSIICSASNVRMLRMKIPSSKKSRLLFQHDRLDTEGNGQGHRFWVSIDSKQLALCREANPGSDEVIVLLDTTSCPHDMLSSESFTGACLLPTSVDTEGREVAIFVCHLRWGIDFPSHSVQGEQPADVAHMLETEMMDGSHHNILIASDIGSWPKMTLNRNSIEKDHTRRSLRTMRWLCVIFAVLFLAQVFIGVLLGPGYIGRMALTAALGLVPSLLLILFVATTMNLAHSYMLLYSMESEYDPSLPWWTRLEYAVVLPNTDVRQPIQMVQLRILLAIARGMERCYDSLGSLKRRFGRQDGQGRIALP